MRLASLALLALAACQSYRAPAPPVAREPTIVNAPFGRTWDATVDHFAAANIAIRTMDRASGFIAAEPVRVPEPGSAAAARRLAECYGGDLLTGYAYPVSAAYNIVVRPAAPDSSRTSVRVTARWISSRAADGHPAECNTRGVWESELEARIKARAEGQP